MEEIIYFAKTNETSSKDCLNIIIYLNSLNESLKMTLMQLIIFDCVEENCIYENGKWQEYNADYVHMLEEEIKTIPAKYCPEYSFYSEDYENYISERKNSGDTEFNKRDRYLTETTFNEYLMDRHEYEYYDKDLKKDKEYRVELMDLYKDKTAYSVKKGRGSSSLAYVIDQ